MNQIILETETDRVHAQQDTFSDNPLTTWCHGVAVFGHRGSEPETHASNTFHGALRDIMDHALRLDRDPEPWLEMNLERNNVPYVWDSRENWLWYADNHPIIGGMCSCRAETIEQINGAMFEYWTWADGDVWTLIHEIPREYIATDGSDDRIVQWEQIDSVSAVYGYEFLETTAKETFELQKEN